MEASAILTVLSAACLWGGAVVYVAGSPTRINPVPWVVWSAASVVAAVNTWAEEGLSGQAIVYAVTGVCFAAVVIRRRRVLGWEGLPPVAEAGAAPAGAVPSRDSWGVSRRGNVFSGGVFVGNRRVFRPNRRLGLLERPRICLVG